MNKLSITINESTAIKGLLIILIILGHAQPLIQIPGRVRSFIYEFHVHCFMILPLLYPIKQLSKGRIKNYFARLMVPYILLFLLFFSGKIIAPCISYLSGSPSHVNYVETIIRGGHSLIMGGYFPLGNSIEVRYLWFLPVMFSFLFLRDYYNTVASKMNRAILLLIGAIFYFILWVCLYPPYFIEIKETVMDWSPFSIWQALGALFMGLTTVVLLEKSYFSNISKALKIVLLFTLVAILSLYCMTPKSSVYRIILNVITPINAFMVIYYYKNILSSLKVLRRFGEHSFDIYIVQTPICIIMYTIIPKFISIDSAIVRAFLFLIVLAVCYYSAQLLRHIKIVNRLLFSRTWDELMGKK